MSKASGPIHVNSVAVRISKLNSFRKLVRVLTVAIVWLESLYLPFYTRRYSCLQLPYFRRFRFAYFCLLQLNYISLVKA